MQYRTVKVSESLYKLLVSRRGLRARDQRKPLNDVILLHVPDEEIIEAYVTNNITAGDVEGLRPGLLKKYAYLDAE